ncbi:hypothetical protein BRADI_5g18571v3 [Brachypodium distachyon]|uniref:Knottin scorpion toxin-like domain-containing protein n=1 Tax=Brachypodium distachyon TaxID=15368 RepID=A0A2K2CI21_BRADI|nr:hypothetical protein BRADI_5g18571v3 [Brachypodium distachyon]
MASKMTAAILVSVLLLALLTSSDAKFCNSQPAKDPRCDDPRIGSESCVKRCESKGREGGLCAPKTNICYCIDCPPGARLEHRSLRIHGA